MQTIPPPGAEQPKRNNSRNQSENKGGRPLGAVSRLAKDAIEKGRASGLLPHEILLSMARGEPQYVWVPMTGALDDEGNQAFSKQYVPVDLEQRRDAAKAAAPYYAPKISTVEVITGVSDDELDAIIAGAAAAAGVSLGADGEGAPGEAAPGPAAGDRPRVKIGRPA